LREKSTDNPQLISNDEKQMEKTALFHRQKKKDGQNEKFLQRRRRKNFEK